jgi:hypothetical protein
MKFISTIFILLWCGSNLGHARAAEDWLVIPTGSPNITFAIDKGSLERNGNRVKFWEKLTYTKPEFIDEASGLLVKEKRVHRIMHCTNKTQGLLHGITYGEQGRFITSMSVDESKLSMSAIPPNTVAEREHALVCEAAHAEQP